MARQGTAWQGQPVKLKYGDIMTEIHPAWRQTVEDISTQFTYGDVITHDWLYEHLHIKKPNVATEEQWKKIQFRLLNDVESIKEELLIEHQFYLDSLRGQGYRVVDPNDQTDVAWNKLRKGFRKLFSAAEKALSNVNYDLLTDDSRKSNNNKLACLSSIRLMAKRSLRDERKNLLQTGTEV